VSRGDQPVVGRRRHQGTQRLLRGEVDPGRQPAEVSVHVVRPLGAGELVTCLAQQQHDLVRCREADRHPAAHIGENTEHPDHRRRVDRHVAGLVVEADVAAGDRYAELETRVGQAAGRLGELPHDVGVLG
jgi:hypothetical protein